nr:MFS transporter [Syntrophothermus sp.]
MYINFLPALLPVMAPRLDLNLTLAGIVIGGSLIAANLAQPVFGWLFDIHPSSRWLVWPVVLSGLLMCASVMSTSYYVFLALTLLAGVANGAYHPSGSTYTYQLDPSNRGILMSLFSSAGALGYALGPMVVAFLIDRLSLYSLFLMLVPAVTFALGIWTAKLSGLKPAAQKWDLSQARAVFKGAILVLTWVMILRAWGHLVLSNYLVFYLEKAGYSYQAAANLLTWFLAAGAVGGIIAGKLSDSLGRTRIIVVSMLLSAVFAGLFLYTNGLWSVLFLMTCGLTVHAPLPVMVVLCQEYLPESVGIAAGLSMGFAWGVGSLGALVNGIVADHWGLSASFWVAALILLAGAVLATGLKKLRVMERV